VVVDAVVFEPRVAVITPRAVLRVPLSADWYTAVSAVIAAAGVLPSTVMLTCTLPHFQLPLCTRMA